MTHMEVKDRVHIAPLGFERDRVVKPAINLKADIVYLLEHDEPKSAKPNYHEDVKADLREAGVDVNPRTCDIFDLYATLGTVAMITAENQSDDVYVNVSSGSKISAIGAMIACMATDATAYYVHPADYASDDLNEPVSYGVEAVSELPTYPIEPPKAEQVAVLEYLDEQGEVTKKQLIEFGEEQGLPFLADRSTSGNQAKYRLLETHIIDPLEEDGYVQIRQVGRQKRVSLTSAGKNARRAFEYLLS
jgi:hypothetical protein